MIGPNPRTPADATTTAADEVVVASAGVGVPGGTAAEATTTPLPDFDVDGGLTRPKIVRRRRAQNVLRHETSL